jgi:hypothetical protein
MKRIIPLLLSMWAGLLACQANAASSAVFYPTTFPEAASFAAQVVSASAGQEGWLGIPELLPLDPMSPGKQLSRLRDQNPQVVFTYGAFATHGARSVLPSAWIICTGVYYPEAEGFVEDERMAGISMWGSSRELFKLLNAGRPVKTIAVLCSEVHAASMQRVLERLNQAGFEPRGVVMNEAPIIEDVVRSIVEARYDALLIVPSAPMANPYRLRYVITECLRASILPVAGDPSFVKEGLLCAVTPGPEILAKEAVATVKSIVHSERRGEDLVWPISCTKIVNRSTEKAFGLAHPLPADQFID